MLADSKDTLSVVLTAKWSADLWVGHSAAERAAQMGKRTVARSADQMVATWADWKVELKADQLAARMAASTGGRLVDQLVEHSAARKEPP